MRKSLLISVLLLACAVWLQAQTAPQSSASQSSSSQMTTSQSTSSGSSKTVQGCLSGSTGSYVLTASNGDMYMLTGNTSELKDHVGHEISVTGKTSGSSATTSSTTSSASGTSSTGASSGEKTLEVESMKHVSASCTSTRK